MIVIECQTLDRLIVSRRPLVTRQYEQRSKKEKKVGMTDLNGGLEGKIEGG